MNTLTSVQLVKHEALNDPNPQCKRLIFHYTHLQKLDVPELFPITLSRNRYIASLLTCILLGLKLLQSK